MTLADLAISSSRACQFFYIYLFWACCGPQKHLMTTEILRWPLIALAPTSAGLWWNCHGLSCVSHASVEPCPGLGNPPFPFKQYHISLCQTAILQAKYPPRSAWWRSLRLWTWPLMIHLRPNRATSGRPATQGHAARGGLCCHECTWTPFCVSRRNNSDYWKNGKRFKVGIWIWSEIRLFPIFNFQTNSDFAKENENLRIWRLDLLLIFNVLNFLGPDFGNPIIFLRGTQTQNPWRNPWNIGFPYGILKESLIY